MPQTHMYIARGNDVMLPTEYLQDVPGKEHYFDLPHCWKISFPPPSTKSEIALGIWGYCVAGITLINFCPNVVCYTKWSSILLSTWLTAVLRHWSLFVRNQSPLSATFWARRPCGQDWNDGHDGQGCMRVRRTVHPDSNVSYKELKSMFSSCLGVDNEKV